MPGGGDYDNENSIGKHITFVYPYGATLYVVKPSVPVLSSGKTVKQVKAMNIDKISLAIWFVPNWAEPEYDLYFQNTPVKTTNN